MFITHVDVQHACVHTHGIVCTFMQYSSVWCVYFPYVSVCVSQVWACVNCVHTQVYVCLDMQVSTNSCSVNGCFQLGDTPGTHFSEGKVLPRRPSAWPPGAGQKPRFLLGLLRLEQNQLQLAALPTPEGRLVTQNSVSSGFRHKRSQVGRARRWRPLPSQLGELPVPVPEPLPPLLSSSASPHL